MTDDDEWNFNYPKIARDSGFKFHQHNDGVIDWRQIGGIEVEKIFQNQNIEKLDGIIMHLAEVPLGPLLNSNILESGIAKYFLLSQLAIQYLIFCKRFLDETVTSTRNTLKELHSENKHLKDAVQEHANDVLQLHKELKKLRDISEVVFPCSVCTKNFVSNEMLNIHISKKHSSEMQRNNGAEKRTEKENDRNLISTIKLELEIKHLKERLNDAEKVIRNQTFEISREIEELKKSPRILQTLVIEEKEKQGKTIGIQNEIISTKNIGIQSNLSEDKEQDDIDTMEKSKILEIFKNINDKINRIEKTRDDDLKNRDKNLIKFENKLQNVTETLEAKQQENFDILNKFTDKMSSQTSLNQEVNLDELKEFLSNAMEKIQNENKKQLHQIVEKFDQTYLEKLNALKVKIESINETEMTPNNSSVQLKAIINKNKEIVKKFISRNDTQNSQKSIDLKPKVTKSVIPKYVVKEAQSSETTLSSESDAETSKSDSISASDPNSINDKSNMKSNLLHKTKSAEIINYPPNYKTSVKERKKIIEKSKNIMPLLKLSKSTSNIPKVVKKMQDERLKTIGLRPNTKLISTSSMPQITKEISNIRENRKRLFPKFNSTRNQIKSLVENMIRSKNTKSNKNQSQILRPQSSKKQTESLYLKESIKKTSSFENESDSENSISSKATYNNEDVQINSHEMSQSNSKETKDEFKSKLERILSSPIHKLQKPNIIDNMEQKTPVPTPRKKVMFDFPINRNENFSSSDDESNKDEINSKTDKI